MPIQFRSRLQHWRKAVLIPLFLVSLFTVILTGMPGMAQIEVPQVETPNVISPIVPPITSPVVRPEIRGVWLTLNDLDVMKDRTKVQDAMNQLGRLNFNTIYPVIWNSGYVTYPSAIAQQQGIQPFVYRGSDGHDILADVVDRAHGQGLLAVPWFEFGFMTPFTSELALNHPNWLTQQRNGDQTSISGAGEVAWLNPFHPEVQKFITSLVVEVMTQYNVDGIQFDDNMSLPREFGYDAYTRSLYKKETKKDVPANPADQAWMRWRANKITAFMAQLKKSVKDCKPNAIVSISPNYYDFAYKFHLQDWLAWVRQGIADELIVQVYRPNLQSFIEKISRPEIQIAQQKIPTGVGVFTGQRTNPVSIHQIQEQTQAARDRGLGVAYFYYESLWDIAPEPVSDRQAGFQSLFPAPAYRSAFR
ncbi:MAG: glycoside hydrolase family 10 protein [Phormidium tanganyikae FI6-MK23]|nr:glycoside hydrolase family 10 protein [Phormidium tanganyikae FI6-MK23]